MASAAASEAELGAATVVDYAGAGPPPPLTPWPAPWSEVRRDTNWPVTTGARATPEDERPSDERAVGPGAPLAVPSEGSVSNEERPEWSDAAELIEARARVGSGV